MPSWLSELFEKSSMFMPHGHCYLWMPSLLWLHVISDALIGLAYMGISLCLYLFVRKIRLPFSPVFIAFGLFIGLCGLTHFMAVWTVWNPDYLVDGAIKAATAAASVATAIGLLFVRPQIEEVVHTARLSEQRRIELETTNAELEALYQQIKDQDELKTRFFSNVSHELRTPLALILGPAERMIEDSNLTSDQKRQLQSISRNSNSLLKQVNDLLDVARLEEGKMAIQYVRLDVAPWLQRIASQFEIAAEHRAINYRISAPDTLIAEVDTNMFERVIINLLSNAFKFTPQQGEIQVELHSNATEFSLSVADSGPGISAHQHQTIFERFRQTDGGDTRETGGTGLGLAIVKDFVALHNGEVDLDSVPGAGAKFTVRLPLSAPPSAEVKEAESLAPTSTGQFALEGALNQLHAQAVEEDRDDPAPRHPEAPAVLVVEDTPDMSRFIAETLADDYNVVTARDGKEGLQKAIALRPDLIITDIMMPRMSGDQLVKELRDRPDLGNIPILLLTAKSDDQLRVALLRSGAQDYLTKPFLPQELRARAGNLVTAKRAADTLRSELASASGNIETLAREIAVKHQQLQTAFESAQVAREQAERASQVKSHFLGMISHEMRTPLSTIHMNTQLLYRHRREQSEQTFDTQLERTVRASRQLSTLIEGLLEYTRVESGKLIAHLEPVNTVALAQEVIEIGRSQISSPAVQLVLAPPSKDLPPFVTDGRLLRVVLNNLISNALKFTSQGVVTLRLDREDEHYVFEVEDTGIGIPQEDIPRIFQPFEQLEPVQRKSIPGVGLGLALTKEIVEALGGTVEVTSEKGVGSTFRVLLFSQSESSVSGRGTIKREHSQ